MLYISTIVAGLNLLLGMGMVLSVGYFTPLWRCRRQCVEVVYALLATSLLFASTNGVYFFVEPIGIVYNLSFIMLAFLAARLHIGRLPEQFLRRNTFLTGIISAFVIAVIVLTGFYGPQISSHAVILTILLIALVVAIGLSMQTVWALTHYVYDVKNTQNLSQIMPTVTLAIPARNETKALSACLDAALASTYQKLEIVVLDDCSHDNTSALIHSYAHAGVRFVQGATPSSGWLGKTNALSRLAEEASGELILFLGVDTHVEPHTISQLVTYMQAHQLDMVSVLPQSVQPLGVATLLQDTRYVWQIILPLQRRRVPVSSEAWAIRRNSLKKLGGFAGVKHKIVPEGSFARRLTMQNRYHFVVANNDLAMHFHKNWRSQQHSAIRLLYPTFKRQPLVVIAAVIGLYVCGLLPFFVLWTVSFSYLWWLALVTCLIYLAMYGWVLARMQPIWWWLSMFCLPLVLAQHIIMIFVSLAQYEFNTVNWKGRNVCYPILLHKRR